MTITINKLKIHIILYGFFCYIKYYTIFVKNKSPLKFTTMKTVEIKLFEFAELSPEAQQKVLEKFAYINVEDNSWHTDSVQEFLKELEEVGFTNASIWYSGFYSQVNGS